MDVYLQFAMYLDRANSIKLLKGLVTNGLDGMQVGLDSICPIEIATSKLTSKVRWQFR